MTNQGDKMSNIDPQTEFIKLLSARAGLPLTVDRLQPVAEVFFVWLKDANALSRRMSAAEHAEVSPITGMLPATGRGEVAK